MNLFDTRRRGETVDLHTLWGKSSSEDGFKRREKQTLERHPHLTPKKQKDSRHETPQPRRLHSRSLARCISNPNYLWWVRVGRTHRLL